LQVRHDEETKPATGQEDRMATKTAELRHDGGMRFVAIPTSGHEVAFDDRDTDTAPGPTETVVAALAACTAMDVISILQKKRQSVERYEVHARAEQRTEYPQVFTRIDLVHELAGPTVSEDALRRCIELSAAKYCPISAMLSSGATEIHHGFRIRNTGPRPFEAEGEVLVTGPWMRPDAT
jgi:putative redox protein